MASIVIQPDSSAGSDTMIDGTDTTVNAGNAVSIDFGDDTADSRTTRSIIKFDLSSIPAGSTINSATLALVLTAAGSFRSNNNRTVRIYRLLRAFVETEATWVKATSSVNWGTAGCSNTTSDREATDIGSTTFNTTDAQYAEKTFTLTTSAIEAMITGGAFTNNGFLIKADTENQDRYFVASCENGTASYRPKLTIDYTPPETGASFLMNFV